MYLKLHGCISRTSDPSIPLILIIDQYITHKSGRDRLFDHLATRSTQHPLVFVGHSLQDSDIRQFLLDLGNNEDRPRYFAVTPKITPPEKRMWESRRITHLEGTFEEFLSTLDEALPSVFRAVTATPVLPDLPIAERFIVRNPPLSRSCFEFLENDVEYVRNGLSVDSFDRRTFYRGYSPRWSATDANLDVRRDIEDSILSDAVLEEGEAGGTSFHVIKGHAGSGKSVLLQRVAWEAATTFQKLCLYLQPHGTLSFDALTELSQVVDERIYVFVDDVGDHILQVLRVLEQARQTSLRLTIVAAERTNEWNMTCTDLEPFLADEFEVRYLTTKEIDQLLALLEENNALFRLQNFSQEERRAELVDKAGRQLLVALHEATLGKPFEDIIADEYAEITPQAAQLIYLGVCFLNRYNVPVRAGIINRVYGVRFTDFQRQFFQPLETLVFTRYDSRTRDYVYQTRHPHIAEIVVDRVLDNVTDNFNMHRDMLAAMNIDYDADKNAFRRLVRGRSLLAAFPDHQMAAALYTTAKRRFGQEPYLFHQEALYEMHRPNGSLARATGLLNQARRIAPFDRTIVHSLAELQIRMADESTAPLEIESHLREAEKLAKPLTANSALDSYGYHTLAKVQLERLKLLIAEGPALDTEFLLNDRISAVSSVVQGGLQKFPDDPYLLDTESQLGSLLSDDDRAIKALQTAFTNTPDSVFVTIRLAKLLVETEDSKRAVEVHKTAIETGANDKQVHFNYARLLIEQADSDENEIAYRLRRGFSEGDSNFEAQFWYARQLYVVGNVEEARVRFRGLGRLSLNRN